MNLQDVRLATPHLAAQRQFFHEGLGLPILAETTQECCIKIGISTLTWRQSSAPLAAPYHFACNIPENQLIAGLVWLQQRSHVLEKDGHAIFDIEDWHAQSSYFRDADGNILEIIARHDMANGTDVPFGSQSLLNISEVGLPSSDALALATAIETTLGIVPWQEKHVRFTTMGDEAGLFILVPNGRHWFPTDQPALPLPVVVTIATGTKGILHLPDLPYHLYTQ